MATTRSGTMTANFRVQRRRFINAGTAFVVLLIISEIVNISGDALHLTMVTPTPYVAGLSQVRFSCFRSSPDTGVDLSFGRPFQIGIPGSSIQSVTTLPAGAYIATSTTPSYATQYLPTISVDSIGLFYCEGSNSGVTTRVYSIIHSNTRRFEPADGLVTKTVNKGEDVTLSVVSVNGLGSSPIWRRIRNGNVDDLNNLPGQNTNTITVPSMDVMDGDLFAVIQSGVVVSDNPFGMIRVIVRGCSAGQWGPPACTGVCNQCYNGGVCDDETGQCICAPGFSGPNCLNACGIHRFGWACEFQCVPGNGSAITSCASQVGLSDPYGSSCISGYSGRDCDTACTAGKFGAGCTETCHCQSGTCNIYTGVCSSGCEAGWSGVNCQVPVNIVGCPTQTVTAVGVTATQVTWTEPTATDASGQQITNVMRSHVPGSFFNAGQTTEVTYTFTDNSGHKATCTFSVFVYSAVNIINCPSQGLTETETTGATSKPVSWTEPTATNVFNQPITNVIKSHQPGDSFNVGETTTVTYTFTDDTSALGDTCIFSVTVKRAVNINGCPDSVILSAASGATMSQPYTWTEPTATDAFGQAITNIMKTHEPGASFTVGQTTQVTYTFTDSSSNRDTCTFTVTVNEDCPVGFFGDDCSIMCHCQNDGRCSASGNCNPSVCASGFTSDTGSMNCQTGIIEFQTLTKTNPGQDVEFSCAATSGNTLSTNTLTLYAVGSAQYANTSIIEGNVLNNTFIVSGLQENEQVLCLLSNTSPALSTYNSVSFFVLPTLSQQPTLTPSSTSVDVTWNKWDMSPTDSGEGPIVSYKVYYSPASSPSWNEAGIVSVTDQSQVTYIYMVQQLEANTLYRFSVAAIREGRGGEGPMSPAASIQTLPIPGTIQTTTQDTIEPKESAQMTTATQSGTGTFVIAAVSVGVIAGIVLVLALTMYCCRRVRKQNGNQTPRPKQSTNDQELASYDNAFKSEPNTATDYEPVGQDQLSAYEPVGGLQSSAAYEDVGLPTWAKPWTVLWVDMMVGNKVLGKGQFGEVRFGGVIIEGEICKAAIKTLKEHASQADRQNFLDEFRSMTKIRRHPNIVRILGACQHEGELYVAMEYLPNGDLRSYLRNARSMDGDESLSSDMLLQFALDVAKGMQHLASSGVIHRDLAARNILFDNNLVAKISDFGLSRGEDIYVQLSKTRVPTRWLSLESLTNQTYTTKTDVWSYGILLWEIATVGGTPYSGMKTDVLTSKLKTGYRMPKPSNCDIKIYDLMLKCWQEKPSDRPSFKKIVSVLTTMTEDQDDQIYMNLLPRSEEHKYVNISPEFDDN